MPKTSDSPPLLRCGAMPCPWMAAVEKCAHRVQSEDPKERLRHALCSFYSMPGPHAPSKIAKAAGLSVETVNERLKSAEAKILDFVLKDPILQTMPAAMEYFERAFQGDACQG